MRWLIDSRKFTPPANNLRRDLQRETIIASASKYSVSHFIDCDAVARRLCASPIASGNAVDEMRKIKT
jgi:hypothetical protein